MSLKILGRFIIKGLLKAATFYSPPIQQGSLWGWGFNATYDLGNGGVNPKSSPIQTLAGGNDWVKIGQGSSMHGGIKADGTLWLWGENNQGQLGTNNTSTGSVPAQTISGGTSWKNLAIGNFHTAATKTDGTLWTWGWNQYGQLGDDSNVDKSSPVQTVTFGNDWNQISCSDYTTGGIKTDGTLWCWGYNYDGQLGDDSNIDKSSPVQTTSGSSNWKQLSLGINHSVAVKTDGTLWTWGKNTHGQLGDDTSISKSSPVQTITFGNNWKQGSAGENHTAAIKNDGTLWCWGLNAYGQLGDASVVKKSSPVQTIAYGSNWSKVECGDRHTLALKTDGSLWSWGYNTSGELGENSTNDCSSPVQTIMGGSNWIDISGGNQNSAGIYQSTTTPAPSGYLWASGYNNKGQLGDNTIINKSSPVQTISGGNNWAKLSQGYTGLQIAAIKSDGTLWMWGDNNGGQLGDNTTTNKSSPVQTISGGNNWKEVSAGGFTTAAIKNDGTLWGWGLNQVGQLGDGTSGFAPGVDKSSPVQTIAGGTNWNKVYSGQAHTAAIKTDGTLWLWGYNYFGQLGQNSIQNKVSPVQTITLGTDWKQVSCGGYHTFAIKNDNTLWGFGYNNRGQLGDNTTINKSSPIQTITYGTNWQQVSCGYDYTAAIKTDGTLWLWGYNNNGLLGDNTTTNKSSPVQTIAYGTNWSKVSVGYAITAAIKNDGTLWAWGKNTDGALGDNTVTNRSSPVQTILNGTNWIDVLATASIYGIKSS